ncbi:MAG: hypothetical protein NTX25_16485 [Proteobacteria bacterium]|nr:hypothetical protein [Pseudomonadota bacterium]
MLYKIAYAVVLALHMGSLSAVTLDFERADALFARRAESRVATQEARAAYQDIIRQSSQDPKSLLRATEGLARSYLYEINAYLNLSVNSDRNERKQLAAECWRSGLEAINPSKLGYDSPVYWYFRANCLTREAEVSSVLERLLNLSKLLESFDKGLATQGGETYEGGGVKRVKAAVKGNPEAKGIPGGLYNPEEALKLIDSAIASEAFPGSIPGNLFCENYRRKLSVLTELQRNGEAKALAEKTIADFNAYLSDGLIPDFIAPETELCVKEIASLSSEIP